MTRTRVLRAIKLAALLLPIAAPSACGETFDSLGREEEVISQGGSLSTGRGGTAGRGGEGGTREGTGGGSAGEPNEAGAGGQGSEPAPEQPPLVGIGISPEAIDERVNEVYDQLFHGDPSTESVMRWVEDDTEAYIFDIAEGDIGLDAFGYGLLASATLERRDDFDALLAFVRNKMRIRTGSYAGYLSRGCNLEFQCDEGTSPDATAFVVTALLVASQRWAEAGGEKYLEFARELLGALVGRNSAPNVTDMFDSRSNLVVYAPVGNNASITSPGYVMPAFYDAWARFDPERAERWHAISAASRDYLARAAHSETGLYPWKSDFNGKPLGGRDGQFNFETCRAFLHIALDYSWNQADQRQVDIAERALEFFNAQGVDNVYVAYELDGTRVGRDPSEAMKAMVAALGLVAPLESSRAYMEWLWEAPTPTGRYRYYDGMLYLLSLLALGGKLEPLN